MKKAIALLLTLLMMLSLIACGSQTDSVGKINEDNQQTEQTNQTEQTDNTQQTETDAAEETEQPETSTQEESVIYTLDNVPKPVMDEMSSMVEEDSAEYASRFPSTSHQELFDYLAALEDDGFTITVTNQEEGNNEGGYTYEAEAVHENATISIYYEWTTPLQGSVVRETGIFDVVISIEEVKQPASLPELPPLPDANWSEEYDEDDYWLHYMAEAELPMEDAKAYVQTLKDNGYTKNVVETEDGTDGWEYQFKGYLEGAERPTYVQVGCHSNGKWTIVILGVQK